jgi:hypothetical protein
VIGHAPKCVVVSFQGVILDTLNKFHRTVKRSLAQWVICAHVTPFLALRVTNVSKTLHALNIPGRPQAAAGDAAAFCS